MTSFGIQARTRRACCSLIASLALVGCGVTHAPTVATVRAGAQRTAHAIQPARTLGKLASMDDFLTEVFRQADKNHDGVLSPAETGLLGEQFEVFDRNHDGQIGLDEWNGSATWGQMLKSYTLFLPMVLTLHHQLDANHDQRVSLAEIQTVANLDQGGLLGASPLLGSEALKSAFSASDKNGDGALDANEFQNFYLNLSTIPTDGHVGGFFGSVVKTLLGAYLSFTGRIASHVALHPGRSHFSDTPDSKWHIASENIAFQTRDGLTIKGWYVPAAQPTSKCVIMLHGRGDNRSMFVRQGQIQWLNPEYNILAIDLRAHGESDGTAVSYGYHEGDDAISALNYVKTRGNTDVAFYGISLGAATAIRATALAPEVKAVIDDCSYATVSSAFTGFCSFDMVPCSVLVGAAAVTFANQELGVDITTTEPVTQVGKLAPRPFLVIHGGNDQYISIDNAHINYEGAGNNLVKQLWVVPGASHAQSAEQDPAGYRQRMLDFLHHSL